MHGTTLKGIDGANNDQREKIIYRRVLEQEGCKVHVQPMCDTVPVERKLTITNGHMSLR